MRRRNKPSAYFSGVTEAISCGAFKEITHVVGSVETVKVILVNQKQSDQ